MKIEHLPSGSYRIRPYIDNKRVSVTFDHKPNQKEIRDKIIELENKSKAIRTDLCFKDAAKTYIESKRNVLSPSTINGYVKYKNCLPEWFLNTNIYAITQLELNLVVNELSEKRSAKTVRNYHGFISAVLKTFRTDLNISTTLPQKRKNEPYIPSDDDIKRILELAKGTRYEIPIKLGCYGLRRGEICALDISDLSDDNYLTINKSMVQDDDKNWIIKDSAKTTESNRTIPISSELADLIRQNGFVYDGYPDKITKNLYIFQDKLGIPHFSLHKCRHYFASKLLDAGIDQQTIQKMGGWETDHVMKTIYQHQMNKSEKEKKASDVIGGIFNA